MTEKRCLTRPSHLRRSEIKRSMQGIDNTSRLIGLTCGWEATIYSEWNFPADFVQEWNALARDCGSMGLFISYGWFKSWWQAFGEQEGTLLVFAFKKEGKTRAIFPCRIKTQQQREKRKCISSLTNNHTCHYDFVVHPAYRTEAISRFVLLLGKSYADYDFYVEQLPVAGENAIAFISELRRSRIPVHSYKAPWAPWREIPRDWITYKKNLPGRLRNSIQRSQKKAEKTGKVNFEIIRDGEQIDLILDTFFEIEFKSWKGRNGTAIKCLPETEAFYRDLAHWAVSNGSFILLVLKLDDVPIAADFCLTCEETIFLLKPAYDESFSNITPGNLLHYKALEYLSKSKQFTRYNFLGGCEGWKMEWTSTTSEYGFIRVYPKSLKGRMQYIYDYGWKNFLKRFGAVRRIKTRIEAKSGPHVV